MMKKETKNADASKRACTEEVKRSGGGVVFLDIIRHKSNGLYIRLNHRYLNLGSTSFSTHSCPLLTSSLPCTSPTYQSISFTSFSFSPEAEAEVPAPEMRGFLSPSEEEEGRDDRSP